MQSKNILINMRNKEIWKDVPGYSGDYKVSNKGRVRSLKNGGDKFLKPINNGGYLSVALSDGETSRFYIHTLVGKCFIENPSNKKYINHIDGDKTNNRVDNLEWVTMQENAKHASKNGLYSSHAKGNSYAKSSNPKKLKQFFLEPDQVSRLKEKAEKEDVSEAEIVRRAIQSYGS